VKKDKLTEKIIGCVIEVHKNPGPGLLESAYEQCGETNLCRLVKGIYYGYGSYKRVRIAISHKWGTGWAFYLNLAEKLTKAIQKASGNSQFSLKIPDEDSNPNIA
jgi:hypothetical protein